MFLSKETRRLKNCVAWLLVAAMFCVSYIVPFEAGFKTAYAEGTEEGELTEAPQEDEPEEAPQDSKPTEAPQGGEESQAVKEPELSYFEQAKIENKSVKIDEECDEFTTVFQNPDGTKTAYLFGSPVRFKDENGKWQEVDSQLVEVEQEKKDKGYKYTNQTNTFDVLLPENMASDVPVSVVFDDYTIEMKPIQVKDTKKEDKSKYDGITTSIVVDKIKNEVKFDKNEDKDQAIAEGTAKEIAKSVKYNSGFDDNIELVYTPTDNGIKEEIILSKYTGQNEFDFLLKLDGVVPELLEDGRIVLKYPDSEEIAGVFTEMYMFDSFNSEEGIESAHYSSEVTYKLQDGKEKGEYILTVVADKAFLEDETTVYPVTIDPSYVYNQSSNQQDANVNWPYTDYIYASSTHLRMGEQENKTDRRWRAYVKHNLGDINGGLVISAKYSAYDDSYTAPEATSDSAVIELHRVTEHDWTASTLTWNNAPDFHSTPYVSFTANQTAWYHMDITPLVSQWYQGDHSNYGFVLKEKYETDNNNKHRQFISSNGSYSCRIPVNIVTFKAMETTVAIF